MVLSRPETISASGPGVPAGTWEGRFVATFAIRHPPFPLPHTKSKIPIPKSKISRGGDHRGRTPGVEYEQTWLKTWKAAMAAACQTEFGRAN